MENQDNKNEFKFTYSAKDQEELRRIRAKYEPGEESKMDQLRKLDAGVTGKATTVSLVFGIVGALVMGTGMSLVMTDIGLVIGLQGVAAMVVGIVTGILGIVLAILAYPMYMKVLKKERERIAPVILQLTEELLK